MSYAIIRNSKLKMNGLNSSSRHNERKNENYGNPNIDTSQTHENYHLLQPVENTYRKELQRIVEKYGIGYKFRLSGEKKSNVACEFIVTSDPSFFEKLGAKKTKQFFIDALDFIKQKVGAPFIISAMVHMDEKTPHMHVTYLPVVEMKNKKGELSRRINCSEFWKAKDGYRDLQGLCCKD